MDPELGVSSLYGMRPSAHTPCPVGPAGISRFLTSRTLTPRRGLASVLAPCCGVSMGLPELAIASIAADTPPVPKLPRLPSGLRRRERRAQPASRVKNREQDQHLWARGEQEESLSGALPAWQLRLPGSEASALFPVCSGLF